MPNSRVKKIEQTRRRATVADLYLQGWSQNEIARHLSLSQGCVCKDLKAVERQWKESAIRDIDLAREIELEKIRRVEKEAWSGWEESRKPAQAAVVTTDGDRQRTQKKVTERAGDPRFLEQIQRCSIARRAVLGLDAPAKIAPTSPDGTESYDAHVMSRLMQLAEQATGPEIIDADYVSQAVEQQMLEHKTDEPANGKPGNNGHG